MRKKLVTVFCALTLAGIMLGCGVENTTSGNKDTGAQTQEEKKDSEDDKKSEDGNKEDNKETEGKLTEPAVFDRMEEWDTFFNEYGSYFSAVQIEDMFFHPGMLGSEVNDVVAASKDGAIKTVSLDKLATVDYESQKICYDTQHVTYYRNEIPWFEVYFRNYTDDLLPYGDCIVTLVMPSKEAMEYSRFFDGTYSMEALRKLKYTDYDKFAGTLEKGGYTLTKNSNQWSVRSKDEFCPASLSEKVLYWTKQEVELVLDINLDTGLVEDLNVEDKDFLERSYCEFFTQPIADDYDWNSEEFKNYAMELYESQCEIEDGQTVELVSLSKSEGGNGSGYAIAIRITDGTEKWYKGLRISGLLADYNENVLWSKNCYFYYGEEDSYIKEMKQIRKDYEVLCYQYDENAVADMKEVTTFSDLTAEEFDAIVQTAKIFMGYSTSRWIVEPVYISFGNAEIEKGELEKNAVWIVNKITELDGYGDFYATYYQYEHFYVPRVDAEAKEMEFEEPNIGDLYSDIETVYELHQLEGTPEENIWVTELLPRALADEMKEKYGYQFVEASIAK